MAKAKNFTEEYVLINGISQYFLHIPNDSKDVIIMLHGGPGIPNSYVAYYQQPYINFCNAVYYDQRGAGKTRIKNKTNPDSLSLGVMLEDLKSTIQYVKEKYITDRVFLVGHSWGTVLGTEYILKYPNDVAGFIACSVCVDMTTTDKIWYDDLREKVLKSGNKKDIKKLNSVNVDYPNISSDEYARTTPILSSLEFKYGYSTIDDFTQIYRKSPIMTFRDGYQMGNAEKFNHKILDVFHGYNIRSIKEYQTPVYYVLGRHDKWTDSYVAAEYFETINAPKKGLFWIENAGHELDLDNPTDFFSTIKEILSPL